MLHDDGGVDVEDGQVGQKRAGGVKIVEVVEGDLTPLQLLHTTEQMFSTILSVVRRSLVRVLPVAQPRDSLVVDRTMFREGPVLS